MPLTKAGSIIRAGMDTAGMSQNRLAYFISADDDIYDATAVRNLLEGKRRFKREVVQRIVDALRLDRETAAELWEATGLMPPATPLDAIRELLDARIKAVATGDSAFAERQRRRRTQGRRSGGTPPPAAGPSKRPSGWSAAIGAQRGRHLTVVRERWAA